MIKLLMQGVAAFIHCLRWSWLERIGRVIAGLLWRIPLLRRREVCERISASGFTAAPEIAREMYNSLATGLLELLWVSPSNADVPDVIDWTDRAQTTFARLKKTGAVIATAHVGSWDLLACAIGQKAKLGVLTKRLSIKSLNAYWQRTRKSKGVTMVYAEGAIKQSRELLRQGFLLGCMIDQVPERNRAVLWHPFFQRPALHDMAPALIAYLSKKPLVLVTCRRAGGGRHELDVLVELLPPSTNDRGWVEEATIQLCEALESYIRKYPSQWLWMHRRWRAPLSNAGGKEPVNGGGRAERGVLGRGHGSGHTCGGQILFHLTLVHRYGQIQRRR